MSDLSDVTILITSFLRPGYLSECLASIKKNLQQCEVVIIDDGDIEINGPDGVKWARLVNNPNIATTNSMLTGKRQPLWHFEHVPFDSGLSAKRNAGVKICETKYLLLGCDDFLFDAEARKGIELMIEALDREHLGIDVAGGRVDNKPYEGYLEYVPGSHIKETRLTNLPPMQPKASFEIYMCCDLTVNYFLGRTDVLKRFPWPEEMKIGGEHVCFFLDLKLAGKHVAWVKGANIKTQPYDPSKQDPRYAEFRARARSLGHPLMKKRYNIQRYIGFEGDVS